MKIYILFSTILLSALSINAQSNFSISGGIKLVQVEKQEIIFWYVDESPSRDNIYKEVEPPGNISVDIGVRFQSNNTDKSNWFIEGQGYFGGINGLALNGGILIGKTKDKKLRFQPEISGVIGYSFKNIGTIRNNDIYIQVNDTKFKDYTDVNVSIENIYFGIKLGINLVSKINDKNEIGVRISYQLSAKTGMIGFSGTGQDGNSANDSENLTEPNVGFYVGNEKTDKIPFNPDGFEFKLFYKF